MKVRPSAKVRSPIRSVSRFVVSLFCYNNPYDGGVAELRNIKKKLGELGCKKGKLDEVGRKKGSSRKFALKKGSWPRLAVKKEASGRIMGWEVRAGRRYYYRKERDPQTGRVRSVYCGGGEKGEAAEREDERRRCATTQVMTNDDAMMLEKDSTSESKIPAIPERRKPTFAEFFALAQPPKTRYSET